MITSCMVMGTNDHLQCLDGWHALESDGRNGVRFRWTTGVATFQLAVPARCKSLRFMLAGPTALTGLAVGLTVSANQKLLGHLPDVVPGEFWSTVDIPAPKSEGIYTVEIRAENWYDGYQPQRQTFTFDHYLGNGDFREMGLMIAAARAVLR